MYDSTLHAKTIARQFRASDFAEGILYVPLADKAASVQRAVDLCATGFPHVSLYRSRRGSKDVYQHSSVEQALLVRHISENVRRVTGVRQSDRQDIVRGIARIVSQGLPFRALKLDIKSFYETVDTSDIIEKLRQDPAFSRQAVHLLSSFFDALTGQQITGLPRGLSISATLAEYVMRPFDEAMAQLKGVRYYSRFVDDTIVILSDDANVTDIRSRAQELLPVGLELSRSKSRSYHFPGMTPVSTRSEEGEITFLGYRIGIGGVYREKSVVTRDVYLDIAQSKVKKVKGRLVKSLLQFNAGGSFGDLLDRVKMLTSNYSFIDEASGQKRFAGLRYNYSLIDKSASGALRSLDRFLLNAIVNTHPSNRIKPDLTTAQKKQIIGLTFQSGFEENRFFTFSPTDIIRITKCWSHA